MARIRTIKPEFWSSEELSALPEAAHILAAALLNFSDDAGYFLANPGLVKASCFPLRDPSTSIPDCLSLLVSVGFIRLGSLNGKRFGHVVNFDRHQRINRPTPSKISDMGIVWDNAQHAHPHINDNAPPERNREQGKEQGTGNRETSSLRSDSSPALPNDPAEPPKLELVNTSHAEPAPSKAERLAQVTADAIEAFNACQGLTKDKGGNLPNVSAIVGRETRQANVKRVLETARAICREDFDSDRVTPDFWAAYFAVAAKDDFYAGRKSGGAGHEKWVPDFEILTRPATMLKLYDRAASEGAAA